jgi:DNA end-binding protein Ku
MARAIWSGSVTFGLVNVPVKAYTAIRDHDVHFHQLERGTGARIRYEKVSEKSGKEVSRDDIELGYEMDHGRYAVIDPEELDELRPQTTRTIEVSDFVDLGEIDPVYYERTYWLAPDGQAAEHAYRLLQAAMDDKQRVGIGTVVMRNKQYLAAIRPLEGALAMSTMRFADEVVAKSAIDALPSRKSKPDAKELRLAEQIVESLSTEWDPKRYHDTYTEELRKLLDKRAKGERVVVEEAPAAKAEIIDLMSALEASLDAAKNAGKGGVHRQLERAANRIEKEAAGKRDAEGDTKRRRSSSKARPAGKKPANKAVRKTAKPSAGQTRKVSGARKSA